MELAQTEGLLVAVSTIGRCIGQYVLIGMHIITNTLGQIELAQTEWLLVAVVFFVAIWNTSVGPSGGVTFATMATLLPPVAVVPIQAVAETTANIICILALRKFIDWRFVAAFATGGLVGFSVGIPFVDLSATPHHSLQILLGVFILITTWIPIARFSPENGIYAGLGGTFTAFLNLFVGGTAALVAATIGRRHQDHRPVIGTTAGCMLYLHATKIPIFGVLGFSFGAYTNLLVFLVAASTFGSYLGRHVLINAPQSVIKPIFKAIVTILALNLLWQGLSPWL